MPNQNEEEKFDQERDRMKRDIKRVDPDQAVRETEDASLPDKEYAFGEDNTGTEEYHDADDEDVEDIFDNEDDLQ
jgi:hypothetical protein